MGNCSVQQNQYPIVLEHANYPENTGSRSKRREKDGEDLEHPPGWECSSLGLFFCGLERSSQPRPLFRAFEKKLQVVDGGDHSPALRIVFHIDNEFRSVPIGSALQEPAAVFQTAKNRPAEFSRALRNIGEEYFSIANHSLAGLHREALNALPGRTVHPDPAILDLEEPDVLFLRRSIRSDIGFEQVDVTVLVVPDIAVWKIRHLQAYRLTACALDDRIEQLLWKGLKE